jgi:hypothetical protein
MKVSFTAVKVNNRCDKMINVMTEVYKSQGLTLNVTDLAQACATKSQAEVTKDFVAAASYILSAAVGGKSTGKKGGAPAKPRGAPLWDPKKIDKDQYLSQTTYYNVIGLSGVDVTVEN